MPDDTLRITSVECLEPGPNRRLTVYWIGDGKKQRVFGVCFLGNVQNIARQGVAESVGLALSIASDMVDQL